MFGGKVKSFDAAKVAGMPGVKKVVQVGDAAVAVVADTWWQAKTALEALPIVWDDGPNAKVSSASIAELLKEGLDAPSRPSSATRTATPRRRSPARPRRSRRSTPIRTRTTPAMEPMNATARYTADKCEVWIRARRTAKPRSRPRWRRPACRPKSATSTRSSSAAASAGAARSDYVQPRRADRQGDAGHADQADQGRAKRT